MKPETPARGILKVNDWGFSKMYKAVCECGNDDCTHTIDIEADSHVNVTIYTTTRTNFWSKTRWTHIWKLLFNGYTDFETTIVMDKQTALNYADAIKTAVRELEEAKHGN